MPVAQSCSISTAWSKGMPNTLRWTAGLLLASCHALFHVQVAVQQVAQVVPQHAQAYIRTDVQGIDSRLAAASCSAAGTWWPASIQGNRADQIRVITPLPWAWGCDLRVRPAHNTAAPSAVLYTTTSIESANLLLCFTLAWIYFTLLSRCRQAAVDWQVLL